MTQKILIGVLAVVGLVQTYTLYDRYFVLGPRLEVIEKQLKIKTATSNKCARMTLTQKAMDKSCWW